MKVSEEIDALRSMGFDPVRWLVVPRCVALVIVMPLLTWIGDALALIGGFAATIAITDMTARAYIASTGQRDHARALVVGLVKSPFLALAIGLIAVRSGAGRARRRRRRRRADDDARWCWPSSA